MYYLKSICFICLNPQRNLHNVKKETLTKLLDCTEITYEFITDISNHRLKICTNCFALTNMMYRFKTMCLKNTAIFKSYLDQMQTASNQFKILKLQVFDLKHQVVKQESVDVHNALDKAFQLEEYASVLFKEMLGNLCTENSIDNPELSSEQEEAFRLDLKQESVDFPDDDTTNDQGGCSEEYDEEYLPSREDITGRFYKEEIKELLLATNEQPNSSSLNTEEIPKIKNDLDLSSLVVFPRDPQKSKQYFCIYCKKKVSKLPRHLMSAHKNETDVKEMLDFRLGSKERKELLDKIRISGTFQFNTDPKYNDGQLIVSRRPNNQRNRGPDHYLPCKICKNFYSKITIRVHIRRCKAKQLGNVRFTNVLETTTQKPEINNP